MIICFLHAGELSIPGCCRFSLILKKLLMLFHPDHRFLFQFTFLIELIQIDKHRFFFFICHQNVSPHLSRHQPSMRHVHLSRTAG